jgi:hypothetical protein
LTNPKARLKSLRPKLAQPIDSRMGRIACNNGTIDGSDRDAGDPVRMDIGFRERFIDAALISPERTPALQQQGNALERELSSHRPVVWPNLEIHCVSFDDF